MAQPIRWERALGGGGTSLGYGVRQTPDGGYVVTGTVDAGRGGDVTDSLRGDLDVWVVKYNAAGAKQWDRRYGSDRAEYGRSVWPTSDGGYLVGACAYWGKGGDLSQLPHRQADYWVLKLDAQGRKQWDRRFGTDSVDVLQTVWQAADGNYMLAGYSEATAAGGDKSQPGRGDQDFWVLKLDGQGNKLWDRTLGGLYADALTSGVPTPDGGSLLVGDTGSPVSGDVTQPPLAAGYGDFWVVKLDAQGTTQWSQRCGGLDQDIAAACCVAPDGGYVVAGNSWSGIGGARTQSNRGGQDYWVVKLSAAGVLQWDRALGTAADEYTTGVAALTGGGYVVGGYTTGGADGDKSQPSQGSSDVWVVGLSAAGVPQWNFSHGGTGYESSSDLATTADGGVAVVGASDSPASGTKRSPARGTTDVWLLKLNASGQRQWDQATGGAADDYLQAVLPAADRGLWLAGQTQGGSSADRRFTQDGNQLFQFWLLERDSLGSARWDTSFVSYRDHRLRSLVATADQGLLLAGTERSGSADWGDSPLDADFVAYKLDRYRRAEYAVELRGLADDWLAEARQTSDQGFVFGGTSRSGAGADKSEASRGGADFWLVKLSRLRVKQWDHRFGGSGLDSLATVRQTADGGYLLAGSTTSPVGGDVTSAGRGGADFWVLKLSAAGAVQWQARYGGTADDWLAAARPTPDGGYLLVGTTASGVGGDITEASRGGRDIWVVKVNATGQLQWQHRYGGSGGEQAATTEIDPDGGYLVGATTNSPVSGEVSQASRGGSDYWLLRLTAQGQVSWDQREGGSGHDELTCLTPTPGYGYALGGFSNSPTASGDHQQPAKDGYDYWPVLLGSRRVVLATTQSKGGASVTVYPNPAHDRIQFEGDQVVETLSLHDALGREVRRFSASATQTYDVSQLPKGVYFLRVRTKTRAPQIIPLTLE
ncbi:hypothetical protein GCM10028822_00300 [Hymenobacter terrigena]